MKRFMLIAAVVSVSAVLCITSFPYEAGAQERRRPEGCSPGAAVKLEGSGKCFEGGRAVCFRELCCHGAEKRTDAAGNWFFRCKSKPGAK
ncbi:MAG: hypothetical protein RDU20_19970 [Desulfomonilaceae bacterium]|nr:hypothetical protein [Desulfomonilaceae bacterium]